MMSLCILDNEIPLELLEPITNVKINDTKCIDENILNYCLNAKDKNGNKIEWKDENLRNFIAEILNDGYFVSAFKSHSFFFNHRAETLFSPDIIIFDWDVGGGEDSVENLKLVLESTYSIVAIFTGTEETEIYRQLNNEFKKYELRYFHIKKEENSAKVLKDKIKSKIQFSYEKSNDLKIKTEHALSEVLSNLGQITFENFICLFGSLSNNERELANLEFYEIIADKLKSALIDRDSGEMIEINGRELTNLELYEIIADELRNALINRDSEEVIRVPNGEGIGDSNVIRSIWHYRLFQKPKDDVVRKGDIIKIESSNLHYFVLSSDCHMNEFWKKNLGHLSIIPIYPIDNEKMKEKLKKYNGNILKDFSITSISNPRTIESITVLPGVFQKTDDGTGMVSYSDGIVYPKEITNIEIDMPVGTTSKSKLRYDNTKIIGDNRIRLTEPFLSPLVQYILKCVTDMGAPDYGKELQDIIKVQIKELNE